MTRESVSSSHATISSKDGDRDKENETFDERRLRDKGTDRYVYSIKGEVIAELYSNSLKCLEPSTYLNDEVVTFYLAYLLQNVCPKELISKVHIFDNICHKILQETFPEGNKKDGEKKKKVIDATKWRQLSKWFKCVNLFELDYLIFPICHADHWYAVIVCHPSEVREYDEASPSPDQTTDSRNKPYPGIIVMDSLNMKKKLLSREIRDFLDFEWRSRLTVIKDFHWENLEEFHPKLPRQTNAYDCGIFMLAYLKAFLLDPQKFYRHVKRAKASDTDALAEMVSDSLVDCSRESIKSLINQVCRVTRAPTSRLEQTIV